MGGIKNKPAQQPPFKPIHKAVMAGQSLWPDLKKNDKKISEKPPIKETVSEKNASACNKQNRGNCWCTRRRGFVFL